MHPRILAALHVVRHDLARLLDRDDLHGRCRALGHAWRGGPLDPFATLQTFLLQVLHGNTALAHLPHLVGHAFTASAFCQARARLPLAIYRDALARVGDATRPDRDATGRWLGHRTLLVDGSSFSMPDTPELRDHFGQSRKAAPGCGFPVAHLMALFHAGTGLLVEVFAAPLHSHDMALADRLHPRLEPGDVLVGDRGFCSFAHLATLAGRGVHAVVRMHQRQIVDFAPGRAHADGTRPAKGLPRSRWVRALGVADQVVAWLRPDAAPGHMGAGAFAALPRELLVRELRYRVGTPGFRTREITLATTLTDAAAYPAADLAGLYFRRWQVETHLHELKQAMGMDVLRCTTVAGVTKELTVYALAYNLVRVVMLEASRRQGIPVERISFTDALRWLCSAPPGGPLVPLVVNPDRPGRAEPRSTKRRPKQYPWMTSPRREMRKRLTQLGDVA